ncbi:hypothetical protein C8J56DRAFT_978852 [Mycena floridula]|nr:hypothetical protein C8J56DRAFT_978852 [Mycena floridula]
MLGHICVMMLLARLGHCQISRSSIDTGIKFGLLALVLLPFLSCLSCFLYNNCRRARRVKRNSEVLDEDPENVRIAASSSQARLLDVYEIPELPALPRHDRSSEHSDEVDHPESSVASQASTIGQQQIRARSQDNTGRIAELEGMVPRPLDAEIEIRRLRGEYQVEYKRDRVKCSTVQYESYQREIEWCKDIL